MNLSEIGITGYASAKYEKKTERTLLNLLSDAARGALKSAGLRPSDIDGLALGTYYIHPDNAVTLAQLFGLSLTWAQISTSGGAGQVASVIQAMHAVATGQCQAVLCVAGDIMHGGQANFDLMNNFGYALNNYAVPHGYGAANGIFAVVQRKHMETYGTRREDLGRIAVGQRKSAGLNDNALLRGSMTMEDYMNCRVIADPIHLYDCVLPCVGAEAVVVTTLDRAKAGRAVKILAGFERYSHLGDVVVPLDYGWQTFSDKLYAKAGYGPKDFDLVQTYDDYPIMVAIQLEDLGFCPKGEVGAFLRKHTFSFDGSFPLNTGGGQLSCGQGGAAGGMIGVTETVRQMWGEAGARQVANADLALISGFGMVGYGHGLATSAIVLERCNG